MGCPYGGGPKFWLRAGRRVLPKPKLIFETSPSPFPCPIDNAVDLGIIDPMKLEDFADISECLRGGIFVLLYRGEVVYVGKATRAMLGTVSNLRSKNLPSWMPRITFDQVLIRAVHPDQIESV